MFYVCLCLHSDARVHMACVCVHAAQPMGIPTARCEQAVCVCMHGAPHARTRPQSVDAHACVHMRVPLCDHGDACLHLCCCPHAWCWVGTPAHPLCVCGPGVRV